MIEERYGALVELTLVDPMGEHAVYEQDCLLPTSFHAVPGNAMTVCEADGVWWDADVTRASAGPSYVPVEDRRLHIYVTLSVLMEHRALLPQFTKSLIKRGWNRK